MGVASWSGSLLAWESELVSLKARLGPVFCRRELKQTAAAFLDGLLSGIERKTGWPMAEQANAERPYRMQSLLGRRHWNADGLRDQVRDYVIEHSPIARVCWSSTKRDFEGGCPFGRRRATV
jgi:SRSO17 transposase